MYRKIFLLIFTICMASFVGCGIDSAAVSGDSIKAAGQGGDTNKEHSGYVNGISMDSSAGVINDTVADIYTDSDVKSKRITQVLFNQPVSILEEKNGWLRVLTVDGSKGWTRSKFVDRDTRSIFGRSFLHKIIVTAKDKSIYSDPISGITLKDVVMGTELYTFNDSGTAYEVYLPGNTTGWIRGSGIIHVDLNTDTPLTSNEDFAASALKFKGSSYLLNGMSYLGIDSMGLIYICARINGIVLPRDLEGLKQSGTKIAINEIVAGDLVFLSPDGDDKSIVSIGICVGNGQYLHASKVLGYVRLDGLNESGSEGKPAFARRIFR